MFKVKKWKVKGFASTPDSLQAFEEKIELGPNSTKEDVKEYYNRLFHGTKTKIDLLGIKEEK